MWRTPLFPSSCNTEFTTSRYKEAYTLMRLLAEPSLDLQITSVGLAFLE
jgi:hypothetical protein